MPNRTGISWTDYSSSPLRYRNAAGETVWACVHASAGCINCYAESLALRFNRGQEFTAPNMRGLTPYLDEREMHKLRTSTALSGKRVFIEDMSDLFGEWVPYFLIDPIWHTFKERPDVTFQVLTKRAKMMRDYVRALTPDPLPNVWIGVSTEDQAAADQRIPLLLETPAAVQFVSAEPLIGAIRLNRRPLGDDWQWDFLEGWKSWRPDSLQSCGPERTPKLDWVIAGGESGPHARTMLLDWARTLRDQCTEAGVAFWYKQGSGPRPGMDALLDGREYHEFPQAREAVHP